MEKEISDSEIWNINFPGCSLEEYRGICWNTNVARIQMFPDIYRRYDEGRSFSVIEENRMIKKDDAPESEF